MIKFIKIKINRKTKSYRNIKFIEDVYILYKNFANFLSDDYANKDLLEETIATIEYSTPYFWVVLKDEAFAGFIFVGNENKLHSAEVTTCFKKEFWGDFTKQVAKKFIRYCLKKLGLKKIKAKVFKENFRAAAILKAAGMKFEAELKKETMKNGKPQDILVYSLIKK